MFRRKFMITCTIFIVAIVATMIWSSFVIKNKTDNGLEAQVIDTRAPNAPKNVDYKSKDPVEAVQSNSEIVPKNQGEAELDNSDITPVITERAKVVQTIDRNYLERALTNQKLVLWNTTTFPLKVHIINEDYLPERFAESITTAIKNWENVSGKFFTFNFVRTQDVADIIIDVVPSSSGCAEGETGQTKISYNGPRLIQVRIVVPQVSCDNKMFNSTEIHQITQHHMGHALGISGHSERGADVMYDKISYENVNISSIDAATIKYLYMFEPEITNVSYTQAELKTKFKLSEIRDKDKATIDKFLTSNLLSKASSTDSLDTKIAAANNYYKVKNYTQALKWYNQALSEAKDMQSRSYIYYSMSVIYLEQNKANEALYNANKAYEEASTPMNAYLIAYINFREGKTDRAREQLEYITQNYPKIRPAYSLLGQIYLNDKDPQKLADLTKKAKEHFQFNPPIKVNE